MKNQLVEINLLRIFAAISIVALHVSAGYVTDNNASYFINQFVRYSSPVFVIMSGIVLYYVESRNKSNSYKTFFMKRFIKTAIPYFSWTIIYTFYVFRKALLQMDTSQFSMIGKKIIINLATGEAFAHLYFVLIMLQLYLIFPILKRWLKQYEKTVLIGSFVVTFSFLLAIYLHQFGIIRLPSLKWSYPSLFPVWLFYFVLGMYFAKNQKQVTPIIKKHFFALHILWIISLAILLIDGKLSNTYAISVKPSTMLYAISSFYLFYYYFYILGKYSNPILRFSNKTAKNSYLIYLIHPFWITIIKVLSTKFAFSSLWLGTFGMVLLFFTVTILVGISIYLINLLPASFILGGNKTAKKVQIQSSSLQPINDNRSTTISESTDG